MGDQPGGGGEDVRGRAIVALQTDHRRAGEVALEAEDVADLGAAPGVDRLVVVADAADVAVGPRQGAQPEVLGDVGVLILVDEDVAELALVAFENVRLGGEQRQRVQQQIAEIAGVQHPQPLLILAVERQREAVGGVRALGGGDLVGHEAAVLPPLDQRQDQPRRGFLGVDPAGVEELLDQPLLVVGVENGEVRPEPDALGVGAQHPRGDGVEGTDPPALDRAAEQVRRPARASPAPPCW